MLLRQSFERERESKGIAIAFSEMVCARARGLANADWAAAMLRAKLRFQGFRTDFQWICCKLSGLGLCFGLHVDLFVAGNLLQIYATACSCHA